MIHRLVASLILTLVAAAVAAAQTPTIVDRPAPLRVDAERVAAAGLRTLAGRHLTLYTDVPSSPTVDELPAVFDAAVPQWAAYFGLEKTLPADWRMNAFLMRDVERFRAAGLIPAHLPAFKNGYAVGPDLWMYEQPGEDYYRRHLLLHEGTHGFMLTQLGHCGPPWYMEGVAELLATHRRADGRLTLGVMPKNRDEVPNLGRMKLIHDAIAAGRRMSVPEIMNFGPSAHAENEMYAWCWALCKFLDDHPRYRARFRQMQKRVADPTHFNDEFRRLMLADWATLTREWPVFADGLEFNTDAARTAIEFRPGRPLAETGAQVTVAADRSWQSGGVRVEAGKTYRLRASGRYQIAVSPVETSAASAGASPKPWPCEPGGVTIRYYRGRPLGMLLASIEPDQLPTGTPPPMLAPIAVGLETTLRPTTSGTLYFRVNDSFGELDDNAGTLTVEVTEK